ncbi:MAG: zf-HC2 domain-containing protein [Chitinivibrionales bacterium]|nr:zf-HC2 domain-containing protein [Chitinivibrionales bacterium]
MATRIMLSCHEASRLASEGRDRKLTILEKATLRFHIYLCAICKKVEKQMHLLAQAAGRSLEEEEKRLEEKGVNLPQESKDRIKKELPNS